MWEDLLKRKKINISHVRVAYARVIEKYAPMVFTMRSFTEKLVEEYKSISGHSQRKLTPLTFTNFLSRWFVRDGFVNKQHTHASRKRIDSFGREIDGELYWVKEDQFVDGRKRGD